MDRLNDTIAALRAALVYASKPGNEGQCLHNGKAYRPVREVLEPALKALEGVDYLLKALNEVGSLKTATDYRVFLTLVVSQYERGLEPSFEALNKAKSLSRDGSKRM